MKHIKEIILYIAILLFGAPWVPIILIFCLGIIGIPLNYWIALILWALLLWFGMLGYTSKKEDGKSVKHSN